MAKIRIRIQRGGETWSLLSRKRSDGKRSHRLLEMLGGHLDGDESPREALIRELQEEERTGRLAAIVAARSVPHASATVDGATHHLFELSLSDLDVGELEMDPEESFGLEMVLTADLEAGLHTADLTYRTAKIFEAFGKAAPITSCE